MSEIIFRGKRLDNGVWVYGHFTMSPSESAYIHECVCGGDSPKKVEPATVGQYTGLTDKNGNKIFNGDILSFVNHYQNAERAWKCVVEYDNNAAAFVCVYIDRFGDERIYNHFDSWNVPLVEWEVIGNRWDNPELL